MLSRKDILFIFLHILIATVFSSQLNLIAAQKLQKIPYAYIYYANSGPVIATELILGKISTRFSQGSHLNPPSKKTLHPFLFTIVLSLAS